MPTEKRTSNTEMVSVPRVHELKILPQPFTDLLSGAKTGEVRDCRDREFSVGDSVRLVEISGLGIEHGPTGRTMSRTITHIQTGFGLPCSLCVLSYAQPAQQYQGEPVALPARMQESTRFYPTGWNACLDEIAKLGPLYTHADPAEVERMRVELDSMNETFGMQEEKIDTLRAQLAEAQALLRDVHTDYVTGPRVGHNWFVRRDAHLSASAEPSVPKCETCYDAGHVPEPMSCKGSLPCPSCAPVEVDERAEFKSWCASVGYTLKATPHGGAFMPGYGSELFLAWKARAALARKP